MRGPEKRSWEEYHISMSRHLLRFMENGRHLRIAELEISSAKTWRIRFSRYRDALWRDARTNPIAQEYHIIANQIICQCIPVPDRPGFCYLELNLDPGVAADEIFLAAEEAQNKK